MKIDLKLIASALGTVAIVGCGNNVESNKNEPTNKDKTSVESPKDNTSAEGLKNNESSETLKDNNHLPAVLNEEVDRKVSEFLTPAVKNIISDHEAGKLDIEQTLAHLERLSESSTSTKEKAFLSLKIGTLKSILDSRKDQARMPEGAFLETRVPEIFSYFVFRNNGIMNFVNRYVQSPQLKGSLTKYIEAENDILVRVTFEGEPFKGSLKEKALKEAQKVALDEIKARFQSDKSELLFLEKLGLLPPDVSQMVKASLAPAAALSAGVPNLSERVSLRGARVGGATVDLSQLMVNGVAGSQAALSMPMYVQLKGSVEGASKATQDLTGVAVYKFDNTLVGIIHGYANTSNSSYSTLNHNETSAVVSRSFGKAYIEGQAGFVNSKLNQHAISGERYQVSFGYDFDTVTPFVQATTRSLKNHAEYATYVGCELDVMNVTADAYTLSGRLTVKGGYHSFKGTVGAVEGSGVLQLKDGVKVEAGLNLAGEETSTARIGFSIDQ